MPSVPPAVMTPDASFTSYPARSIGLKAITPIKTTTAPTRPLAMPQNVQTISVATASDAGTRRKERMFQYNWRVLDEEAHYIHSFWWNRLVPLRSYVHGWKIGPSHYSNQDLGTIWLSAPECGACSAQPTLEKASTR